MSLYRKVYGGVYIEITRVKVIKTKEKLYCSEHGEKNCDWQVYCDKCGNLLKKKTTKYEKNVDYEEDIEEEIDENLVLFWEFGGSRYSNIILCFHKENILENENILEIDDKIAQKTLNEIKEKYAHKFTALENRVKQIGAKMTIKFGIVTEQDSEY